MNPSRLLALAILLMGPGNTVSTASISDVRHEPREPHARQAVRISAQAGPGVRSAVLEYQLVEPGKYIGLKDTAFQTNWVSVPMNKPEANDGAQANEALFTATLPGTVQQHRRLVRYRIVTVDAEGRTNAVPDAEAIVPNFAYFVYDGIPSWRGAIEPRSSDPRRSTAVEFSAEVMRRMPAYHLIGRKEDIENATWRERTRGKEYKYTGTMVFEGRVYDHVRYRARGGSWRYAMGKNMWKVDFNKGQPLAARDDYGRLYSVQWDKLNLRACIDHADYRMRGNQGMFESAGFRLFNLAGVESPATHWAQLRIIDEPEESPADQYRGDFWGLFLAIENEDGRFLKQHGLPDGNLYKMEFGDGTLQSNPPGAAKDKSDLRRFMSGYQGDPPEEWWREHLELQRYYSYRAILECIHHYDVDEAQSKNYDYYLNPATQRWQVIPWDIDLTWADHMYGNGDEPFRQRLLPHPAFAVDYQNRLREIRDLLFNTNQAWALLDECAAIPAGPRGGKSPLDADRAKWDFHPIMAMGGKAGQGLFYRSAPAKDFPGMVKLMKDYVASRARWVDSTLLTDQAIPEQPVVNYAGPEGFPAHELKFRASEFKGSQPFAARQWRLAEVASPVITNERITAPGKYEISPVWQSDELAAFTAELKLPPDLAAAGRAYRVRVRMKDATGRWSHWSAPVEFTPTP